MVENTKYGFEKNLNDENMSHWQWNTMSSENNTNDSTRGVAYEKNAMNKTSENDVLLCAYLLLDSKYSKAL